LIHVKATVMGEADMPPLTKIFQDDSKSENVFLSSVNIIKARLAKNLRINLNETLLVYCAYIINELRHGKSIALIINNVKKILSIDNVTIGVPESLRKLSFDVLLDNNPKVTITLDEPIPTSDYILLPNNTKQV